MYRACSLHPQPIGPEAPVSSSEQSDPSPTRASSRACRGGQLCPPDHKPVGENAYRRAARVSRQAAAKAQGAPAGLSHKGRNTWTRSRPAIFDPWPVVKAWNARRVTKDSLGARSERDADVQGKTSRDSDKRGWAISVLREVGAIRECEEHGWMQDRADPHACGRALEIALRDPPAGVSRKAAVAEIGDVLDSIGDSCPECPSEVE